MKKISRGNMPAKLDLADIQGGILRAYGRQGFPKARYLFFTVRDAGQGPGVRGGRAAHHHHRRQVGEPASRRATVRGHHPRVSDVIRDSEIDDYPGLPRFEKPKVAVNIAFSFLGLLALEVPTRTLRGMPDEFMDGMEARAAMLGDTPFLDKRDALWREAIGDRAVHIFISLNGEMDDAGAPVKEIEDETNWLRELCAASDGGVAMLSGNGPTDADYQSCSAVLVTEDGKAAPTNKEHFGLSDGFGDPVFEGQLGPDALKIKMIGGGKLQPDQTWAPLATGEFLLGYPDEAQEIPPAGMPLPFSRNGAFMAYRKLHENVVASATTPPRRAHSTARRKEFRTRTTRWRPSRPSWSAAGRTACR